MGIDPAAPDPQTPEARAAEQIAALRRRISDLERTPTFMVGDGPPTIPAADVREGTPYVDRTNNRLFIRVGAGWRYTNLT